MAFGQVGEKIKANADTVNLIVSFSDKSFHWIA
jgi:hypothetical protein